MSKMKKFNKKQILIAALALPLLLASYWIIRCQITSGAEHTFKLAITEKTNLDDYSFDIYYEDSVPAYKWRKEDCYVSFHTDEDGVSHPSGVNLFPPLCKTSIHTDRYELFTIGNTPLESVCTRTYETDMKNYFWIDRLIAKAFKEGKKVYAVVDVKKYKSQVSSIEIEGKDVVDMIPNALQHPDEMLNTMATRIGERVEKKCATDYCDPHNELNHMREITNAVISSYLLEAIKYLWNERKQDSSFVAMVKVQAVECYFTYNKLAYNDMFSNAVSQLASSYYLVNEDNYQALFEIFKQDGEKNEYHRLFDDFYNDHYLEHRNSHRDSCMHEYITKIKELTYNEELYPKKLDNIGFWVRRWEDGSAKTIYEVLQEIDERRSTCRRPGIIK